MVFANFTLIHLALTSSLIADKDLQLKPVSLAYKEFVPICQAVGPILIIFCEEIRTRSNAFDSKIEDGKYETMSGMVQYEKQNKLIHNGDESGTKLLRLMLREMEFIRIFLIELEPLGRSSPSGNAASKAFSDIYRPYLSPQIAEIAAEVFKHLPNKGDIFTQACGSGYNGCQDLIGPVVDSLDQVDSCMETYLRKNDVLDIIS